MIINAGDYEITTLAGTKAHPGGWTPLSVTPNGTVSFYRPVDPPPEKEARDTNNCLPRSPIVLLAAARELDDYANHLENNHDAPHAAKMVRSRMARIVPDREQRPQGPIGQYVSHQDAVDVAEAIRKLATSHAQASGTTHHITRRYNALAARIDPDTEE